MLVLIDKEDKKNKEPVEDILDDKLRPFREDAEDYEDESKIFWVVVKKNGEDYQFENKEDIDIPEEEIEYKYPVNPNAKWDWWVIGGRWDNMLMSILEDESIDMVAKKNFDRQGTLNLQRHYAVEGWKHAFREHPDNPQIRRTFYNIEPDMTQEEYIRQRTKSAVMTYAVLTKENEWIEGEELDKENIYEEYIEPLDDDDIMVIVDYHI